MTRNIAIVVTMMGVLMMSMPGGACFIWSGLGVEHHHHAEAEGLEGDVASDVACFHEHDDCAAEPHACDTGSDPDPERPCSPDSQETEALAFASPIKIDPAAQLEVDDFVPDWLLSPEAQSGGSDGATAFTRAAVAAGAKPPPIEVRLCRFLL